MMRSMFTGVSGLRTHQTKMDVIAHNISNVNTVGFKSSRVTFMDAFSQTLSGASRANDATGRGGTNPMQIGLGVNVGTIDKMMSTGAAQRTDRAFDAMINGDGFFIVGDATGTYFTRAGNFDQDLDGYIVMGNGMKVYGWDVDATGDRIQKNTTAAPIQIAGQKAFMDATATTTVSLDGNLNPKAIAAMDGGELIVTMSFFDSIGTRYVVDVTITYDETWTAALPPAPQSPWVATVHDVAYPDGDKKKPGVYIGPTSPPPSPLPTGPVPTAANTFYIGFDSNGAVDDLYDIAGAGLGSTTFGFVLSEANFTPTASTGTPTGTPPATIIDIDVANLRQLSTITTSAKFNTDTGNEAGSLEGMSIGNDGIITGLYSNGLTKLLGQIVVAKFQNPAGLEAYGNNLYRQTANSGEFNGIGEETGDMMGGVLEMSNVDLANEFTEMITTQRGFQASSRLITTSDDMIQELVNLKR